MRRASPLVQALRLFAGAALVSAFAAAMLAAQLLTAFRARRFCAEVLGRRLGLSILALYDVELVLPAPERLPSGQVVYVANHTSIVDVFALIAAGLPRTRFFLKRAAWSFPPLGLAACLLGTFFTVPQKYPQRRTRIFQRAERALRSTGDSVLLSPEGTRVTSGEIGPFNKGAFHLATVLGVPIQPLYIELPRGMTKGKELDAASGVVRIHLLPQISTEGWRLEELLENKEKVRGRFLEFHAALRAAAPRQAA